MTLGLPIVRAAPDHGTAFGIAGQDRARARRHDRCDPHGRRAPPTAAPRAARSGLTSIRLPPLREVIARHGLAASKALGQNFLLDGQLLDRIARVPGDLMDSGGIRGRPRSRRPDTRIARGRCPTSTAVERDARCLPPLAELAEACPRPVARDRRRRDGGRRRRRCRGRAHIVANLPYNVGTALLVRWLRAGRGLPGGQRCSLMFQKRGRRSDRRAGQCSDAFGRLAVLAQWRSTARIALTVHRSAFAPPPKVMSAVVHIEPRRAARRRVRSRDARSALTAAAFGQRRKMLRQSLKGLDGALAALAVVGIDSTRRPETVSIEEFVSGRAGDGRLTITSPRPRAGIQASAHTTASLRRISSNRAGPRHKAGVTVEGYSFAAVTGGGTIVVACAVVIGGPLAIVAASCVASGQEPDLHTARSFARNHRARD